MVVDTVDCSCVRKDVSAALEDISTTHKLQSGLTYFYCVNVVSWLLRSFSPLTLVMPIKCSKIFGKAIEDFHLDGNS